MKRYDCLQAIAPHFGEELVVTNLGAVRHEWQALRPHPGNYHLQNLGLTSSMALGLALALTASQDRRFRRRRVFAAQSRQPGDYGEPASKEFDLYCLRQRML